MNEELINGKVIPYVGGKQVTDTNQWREPTDLELRLKDQINLLEKLLEDTREDVKRWQGVAEQVEYDKFEILDQLDNLHAEAECHKHRSKHLCRECERAEGVLRKYKEG